MCNGETRCVDGSDEDPDVCKGNYTNTRIPLFLMRLKLTNLFKKW